MVQRRSALVLLLICAALVAALAFLPVLSTDDDDGAHAASLAAASPYGRLVIAQEGINARITSHQVGVSNPGSGAVQFGPLTVVKTIDAGTSKLFEDVAGGAHVPQVVVRVFKPNTTDERVVYTLEDVVVKEFQHRGAAESLSFTYGKITIEASGNSYCYDVVQRKKC
jgi:type VI secretion system (T6SS) effector Hcp